VFADSSNVPAQSIFMTTASGADNTASNQPAAVPLAGLPSYDDVLAHSDIYVGFFITGVFAVR